MWKPRSNPWQNDLVSLRLVRIFFWFTGGFLCSTWGNRKSWVKTPLLLERQRWEADHPRFGFCRRSRCQGFVYPEKNRDDNDPKPTIYGICLTLPPNFHQKVIGHPAPHSYQSACQSFHMLNSQLRMVEGHAWTADLQWIARRCFKGKSKVETMGLIV